MKKRWIAVIACVLCAELFLILFLTKPVVSAEILRLIDLDAIWENEDLLLEQGFEKQMTWLSDAEYGLVYADERTTIVFYKEEAEQQNEAHRIHWEAHVFNNRAFQSDPPEEYDYYLSLSYQHPSGSAMRFWYETDDRWHISEQISPVIRELFTHYRLPEAQ